MDFRRGGTARAVTVLLNELEPIARPGSLPTAQVLMAKFPKPVGGAPQAVPEPAKIAGGTASADPAFTRDVLPIFQKPCVGCHRGEKPKGDLSVETLAALLKGGQSGGPAIVPGKPDASPWFRFVQDQVEVLEMPPVARRTQYPALTRDEIARLASWIDRGTVRSARAEAAAAPVSR